MIYDTLVKYLKTFAFKKLYPHVIRTFIFIFKKKFTSTFKNI